MTKRRFDVLMGIGTVVVAIAFAVAFQTRPSARKPIQCLSVPCAYSDGSGGVAGRCGVKPSDPDNCYCYKLPTDAPFDGRVRDTWPSQLQAACEH